MLSGHFKVICIDLILDLTHVQMNALGHFPTPLSSVESCYLRLFPGESHNLKIFLDNASPVCPWLAWSPLELCNLPVKCLLWHSLMIHPYHMTDPAQSSFTGSVLCADWIMSHYSSFKWLLWPPYGIGYAIIFLRSGFFFYLLLLLLLSFFPRLISDVADWMSAILAHVLANLGCRSETCCTRLAENTGRKKSPKIRHLGTITQLCPAISSQLRHVSTIGGKNFLNNNSSATHLYNMV